MVPLETPRDRNGSYEPRIISKGQTRFTGFDDKSISMYARGMSTREISDSDMRARMRDLERGGTPAGPERYLVWAQGIDGDYRQAKRIAI